MNPDWQDIILDTPSPGETWTRIFAALLELATSAPSPQELHAATVTPDRLLAEAARDLWAAYPETADRTSARLKTWAAPESAGPGGRAVLILDALSLRELPILVKAAEVRDIAPVEVRATGAECPTTTGAFAESLGLSSRSALADDGKPANFSLFGPGSLCRTDALNLPFADCPVPPAPNLLIWHSWLDDLIHLHKQQPDQLTKATTSALQGDGFWGFVNRLRQGRKLVITSDHGYAVSKYFSTEITDPEAVEALRQTFGASRCKAATELWRRRFMPPVVMSHKRHHIVMGQRKWKAPGGFPALCHGGMSLLEVAVPWIELEAL